MRDDDVFYSTGSTLLARVDLLGYEDFSAMNAAFSGGISFLIY
jgi:hypothetical protein